MSLRSPRHIVLCGGPNPPTIRGGKSGGEFCSLCNMQMWIFRLICQMALLSIRLPNYFSVVLWIQISGQEVWQRPQSPGVSTPDRMSIRSAIYAQSDRVTDRLTDAGIIDCNSPHLLYSILPNWHDSMVFAVCFSALCMGSWSYRHYDGVLSCPTSTSVGRWSHRRDTAHAARLRRLG